jgi:hypothetical protein
MNSSLIFAVFAVFAVLNALHAIALKPQSGQWRNLGSCVIMRK